MTRSDPNSRIVELHLKARHRSPMTSVDRLLLSADGVEGDASPSGRNPRQIAIVHAESLRTLGITGVGSRSNMVIDGQSPPLRSGALVRSGDVAIRITFACEPCAHGVRLAGVPMSRFRGLARFLGVVVEGGLVESDSPITVDPCVFESAPDDFLARALWAVERIPPGSVVTSTDFLLAIGASRSYARVLPRWMRLAHADQPIHRVLRTDLGMPSWCANAEAILAEEGLKPDDYRSAIFPLAEELWFQPFGDASVVDARERDCEGSTFPY